MDNASRRILFDATVWTASLVITLFFVAHAAWADSERFIDADPAWKAECGSCHIAYPPRLLPAPSWRRIMSTLDRHFGADAGTDAKGAGEIAAFLERNAGGGKRVRGAADSLRITEGAWFRRKHDEVPAATWKLAAVKTPANCAACHALAEQGDFRERNIRMPR